MSKAVDFCCYACGAELPLEALFGHEQDRTAFGRLAMLSIPVGGRVVAYVGLFAPVKNRMTIARKAKLIEELLPDLQRQAITRAGRDWEAPHAAWSLAIENVLTMRDNGKLTLPLTSHGYLYAVLQGMAEKIERGDEAERERQRKERTTTVVRGGAVSVLDALPEAPGATPAVPKTAPPPSGPSLSPLVRAMRAAVKAQAPTTSTEKE
jgi:hypothetical protein